MATKILTDIVDLPFVWWLTRNGKDIQPTGTGRLGAFPIGTILTINLWVVCEHSCFSIRAQDPSRHIAKKAIGDGVYQKKITVTEGVGQGLAPRWPSNIVCLDADGQHFTVGIQQQRGIFYFIIEEYTQTDDKYESAQVKWFSALRGFGAVASGNPLFDFKVHWTACPKRDNGLRYLNSGEQITWNPEKEVDSNGLSTFIKEIKKAELVH